MYMGVLPPGMSMHHMHALCVHRGQKATSDLLELELYLVVTHHAGAEN